MKVAILSTYDTYGGAAIAAHRLNTSLNLAGMKSYMIIKKKFSEDPNVVEFNANRDGQKFSLSEFLQNNIVERFQKNHLQSLNTTFCSLSLDDIDILSNEYLLQADIVNIHWCSMFLSAPTIRAIMDLGKPVIWTLHDQWAFTGGCHYSDGCNGYKELCNNCPQLNGDSYGLFEMALWEKKISLDGAKQWLTIVTPSNWIKKCASESKLFKNNRIEVIPNSIDIAAFQPISKTAACKKFGIDPGKIVLAFIASDMNERRKGVDILCETLQTAINGPLKKWYDQRKLCALLVGYSVPEHLFKLPIETYKLEFVSEQQLLRDAYCCSDVMLFTSREDNLPNNIIEAMSLGVPTVAFDVGGCSDIIDNGENGYLIKEGDKTSFSQAIAKILDDDTLRQRLRKNCISKVGVRYSFERQGQAYKELFERVLNEAKSLKINPIQKHESNQIYDQRLEMLSRLTGMRDFTDHSKNVISVTNWLDKAVRKDPLFYLTSPKEYAHPESGYDQQYGISPDDFSYGKGLCSFLEDRGFDFSGAALEIGCGTGILSMGVAKQNKFPLFVASDASPAFLHILHKKLENAGIANDRTRLAVLDGDSLLGAPTQAFSLIVLKATLHHITDPEEFIKSMSNLLTSNGVMVFHEPFWEGTVILGIMAQALFDKRYSRIQKKIWRLLMGFFGRYYDGKSNSIMSRISKRMVLESDFARLKLLVDTMQAASTRNIDKSTWEDKHVFRVSDLVNWSKKLNLDVEFIPNREFNDFDKDRKSEQFTYRKFIYMYIAKCMNYGQDFATKFCDELPSMYDFLDKVSAGSNDPHFHGIFILKKKQSAKS